MNMGNKMTKANEPNGSNGLSSFLTQRNGKNGPNDENIPPPQYTKGMVNGYQNNQRSAKPPNHPTASSSISSLQAIKNNNHHHNMMGGGHHQYRSSDMGPAEALKEKTGMFINRPSHLPMGNNPQQQQPFGTRKNSLNRMTPNALSTDFSNGNGNQPSSFLGGHNGSGSNGHSNQGAPATNGPTVYRSLNGSLRQHQQQ